MRDPWDNFDVKSPDGTEIEVKSSAYLQSWPQSRLSTIGFSGLRGLRWDPDTGWGEEREVRADIFVFAVQTCRNPQRYDPLDIDQWDFYVVGAEHIRKRGVRSLGMSALKQMAPQAVAYRALREAIVAATSRSVSRSPAESNGLDE